MKCDGCEKVFTAEEYDVRHTMHEPGCPNDDPESELDIGCDCNLNYHQGCCPECKENKTIVVDNDDGDSL